MEECQEIVQKFISLQFVSLQPASLLPAKKNIVALEK